MEAQLVQIRAPGCWSANARPRFCQPVRLAHRCRAGCVPRLSESIQLALMLVSFPHDQILYVG